MCKWIHGIVNYHRIRKQIIKNYPNYKFNYNGEIKNDDEIADEDEFADKTKKELGKEKKKKEYPDVEDIEYDEIMGAIF